MLFLFDILCRGHLLEGMIGNYTAFVEALGLRGGKAQLVQVCGTLWFWLPLLSMPMLFRM
jgi:hypothetical protein